ncbi:MAG: germination protein YpeB [Clostridia bacterium]|nr:germination protein YpeB [Clostridia bacterium]
MEEKKETKVAKNVSSGAEKVERIEKNVKTQKPQSQATQKTVSKKVVTEKKEEKEPAVEKKTEKENERAQARVAAALKKKEEKAMRAEERAKAKAKRMQEKERRAKMTAAERKAEAAKLKAERKERMEKRLAERKAKAEKKRAERKAKAAKRAAERKEMQEKRKAAMEARQRERAHQKANRSQEKSKNKQKQNARKKERKENRGGNKGYGGWLAAVISLGAVTLGLTTAVTVGAIEMRDMQNNTMTGVQSTTYELIGIMEHVDDDLDRARISASSVQQERILTDLLVQARLAELDLEKLPINGEADRNLTSFINKVGAVSERMLSKLRRGEALSEEDENTLQSLYETNHAMRQMLDEYASKMTDKDIMSFMKKGEGVFSDMVKGLENLTLEENRAALEGKMQGAGMKRATPPSKEESGGSPKIDTAQAEELCLRYFSDYKITEFQCVGETVARGYAAYNVQGYDDKGTLLFAEIDYNGGELIRFDYYEPCEGETFDMKNAETIAQNFLEKLGYEDMTAVRTRENGTDVDFSFVYETDGVVYYPDTVRVKVCRSRGVVTGFDASKYLQNHENREEVQTGVTMAEAQAKLRKGLEVECSRLAVVKAKGGERAAYEFLCSYMDEKYLIYTDAVSGEEIAILNIKNL